MIGSADIPTHLATQSDRLAAEQCIEAAITVRHLLVHAAHRNGEESPTGEHRRAVAPPARSAGASRIEHGRRASAELARRTKAGIRARDALA